MKIAIHGVFLFLFSVLQSTWVDAIAVLGVKPNLFFIYIIVISCFCSKKEGAATGFFFGLILDFLIGKVLGLNAMLLLLFAFLTATFCEKVIRKNSVFILMLMVLVSSVFYGFLYYTVSFLGNLNFGSAFLRNIFPECIYNSVMTIPVFLIVERLSKKLWIDKGEGIG